MSEKALEIIGLSVDITVGSTTRPILRDVSLSIEPGRCTSLVGESGSGKSMTARTVLQLLPPSASMSGDVRVDGRSVMAMSSAQLRRLRSTQVGMVFQDPRAHINPVRTIGAFLVEGLVDSSGEPMRRNAAWARAVELLDEVGISEPHRVMKQYPHELSGGMLQRVAIASALAPEPGVILADEPTTALDVVTQAGLMALFDRLCHSRGLALLFITHDLDLALAISDNVSVMYAGEIVESRSAAALAQGAEHPYTAALLAARPSVLGNPHRLPAPTGAPMAAFEAPQSGCAFAPRCSFAQARCSESSVGLTKVSSGCVRCVRSGELGRLSPAPEVAAS